MASLKMALVEWDDAWSTGRKIEVDSPKLREGMIRKSVGFLLCRSPRVVLAQTDDSDGEVQDTLSISRGSVRKITELKER